MVLLAEVVLPPMLVAGEVEFENDLDVTEDIAMLPDPDVVEFDIIDIIDIMEVMEVREVREVIEVVGLMDEDAMLDAVLLIPEAAELEAMDMDMPEVELLDDMLPDTDVEEPGVIELDVAPAVVVLADPELMEEDPALLLAGAEEPEDMEVDPTLPVVDMKEPDEPVEDVSASDDPALPEAVVSELEVVMAPAPLVVLVVLLESPLSSPLSSPPLSVPVASVFIAPS